MEEILIRDQGHDPLAKKLRTITHGILVVIFGLLPLVFLPFSSISPGYTKTIVVVYGIAIAAIFFSLSVLRSGKLSYYVSYPLLALWGVVVLTLVSALLSGDLHDALLGDFFSIHTTGFVVLLAITVSVWTFIEIRKEAVMRLYLLIILSTFILALYHFARLLLGPQFLSFGVLTSSTSSPFGGWNDLALFLGLTILLSLVTLEQLPLTKWAKVLFGFVVSVSLIILAIINFYFVWIVLGIVSAVVIIYSLGKDRFIKAQTSVLIGTRRDTPSFVSLSFPLVVCVISGLFIFSGSVLSSMIGNVTQIPYVEVRPSFEATADIAQTVYQEKAFFGIGANRFADAWRLHKNVAINPTIFWNTNFQSGSGYIPTFFVTTGILGGVAWIIFLALFVLGGVRMLLKTDESDRVWYFIGTSSFVGATFVWGMSLVYVPGPAVLLLGALCTGLTFVAQSVLLKSGVRVRTLAWNRRSGFVLTLIVMVIIASAVGSMYILGKQYAAAYLYAKGVTLSGQTNASIEDVEGLVAQAFTLSLSDVYARDIASLQLARMQAILSVSKPTEAQLQQFQTAAKNGINSGKLAIEHDATEPDNWSVLGRIYAVLATAHVDGAYDLAKENLEHARSLDPQNPRHIMLLAQLEASHDNLDEAYKKTQDALTLKPNYSDALYFSSQLDVAKGNVDGAIQTTRAMISITPDDATRYYQLGVLESSKESYQDAAGALEEAVRLSPSYSNARYFLAFAYVNLGRNADALAQLNEVLALNPGNESVTAMIEELKTTGTIAAAVSKQGTDDQIVEGEQDVTKSDDDVVTKTVPDTPLVSTVNTPAETPAASDTDTTSQ